MHLTYNYRIKDKASKKVLSELASKVNFVWNYCNEVSYKSIKSYSRWLSKYDLQSLTATTSKDLSLRAKTIQLVCHEYAKKRYQHKKLKLRWRSKKSLGWIPINCECLKIKDDEVIFMAKSFRFWKSREMEGIFKFGSFSQDSRGHWYINLTFEQETPKKKEVKNSVGIKACIRAAFKFKPQCKIWAPFNVWRNVIIKNLNKGEPEYLEVALNSLAYGGMFGIIYPIYLPIYFIRQPIKTFIKTFAYKICISKEERVQRAIGAEPEEPKPLKPPKLPQISYPPRLQWKWSGSGQSNISKHMDKLSGHMNKLSDHMDNLGKNLK